MSLHVSGQEASNCLAFFKRAMQRWEAEQAAQAKLMQARSRLFRSGTKTYKQARKSSRAGSTNPRRVWTVEQLAVLDEAIRKDETTQSVAVRLGIPYSAAWTKRNEVQFARRKTV